MLSDDLARPSFQPFHVEAVYEWIECDLKKYPGFKCEVRINLKNRERKKLNDLLNEIEAENAQISENTRKTVEEIEARKTAALEAGGTDAMAAASDAHVALIAQASAAYDANIARYHVAITPYIRDWNLATRDEAGNVEDIPPPMTAGVEAFEDLDQTLVGWLVTTLLKAYRGGKGFNGSPLSVGGSDEPMSASNETTPNDEAADSPSENSPPSPESSRSRSRSRSKT